MGTNACMHNYHIIQHSINLCWTLKFINKLVTAAIKLNHTCAIKFKPAQFSINHRKMTPIYHSMDGERKVE